MTKFIHLWWKTDSLQLQNCAFSTLAEYLSNYVLISNGNSYCCWSISISAGWKFLWLVYFRWTCHPNVASCSWQNIYCLYSNWGNLLLLAGIWLQHFNGLLMFSLIVSGRRGNTRRRPILGVLIESSDTGEPKCGCSFASLWAHPSIPIGAGSGSRTILLNNWKPQGYPR